MFLKFDFQCYKTKNYSRVMTILAHYKARTALSLRLHRSVDYLIKLTESGDPLSVTV